MTSKTPTVAEMQAELDEIIAWFEADEIDIDEAVKKYERGMKITADLEERLETAKNTITKLKTDFASGKA